MTRVRLSVVAFGINLVFACGGADMPGVSSFFPTIEPERKPVWVGVARAEITVPPGASTFGHGPDARVANGFWTRTYCRVFYFESRSGEKLAIVPCEMASMSTLLQRSVAEELGDSMPATRLMMTAVHTHAGVAHYFDGENYGSMMSTRLPGFDSKMLNYLTTQIVTAIKEAMKNKKPAVLSWHHGEQFWGFSRNRSIGAFLRNRPRFYREPPTTLNQYATVPELKSEEVRAVDPALHILRIDEISSDSSSKVLGPLGSISFFAMHPTVIRNTNRLFGGDVAGVVSRVVEKELRRSRITYNPEFTRLRCYEDFSAECRKIDPGDPLHGIINTNEGDISPIWSRGTIEEAIEIGERIGKLIWGLHPKDPTDKIKEVAIGVRYLEVDMRGARFMDGYKELTLCDYAELGQGAARGASDHPTSLSPLLSFEHDPVHFGPCNCGYEQNSRCNCKHFYNRCFCAERLPCQTPKRPLLGFISSLSSGEGVFPSHVPLALVRIDDTWISFLPIEMTITAGHRVNQRVLWHVKTEDGRKANAIVAGLANGYLQYGATEEEYQLQRYEGASTLYGPNTAKFLATRMALLARSMAGEDINKPNLDKALPFKYKTGPERVRFQRPTEDEAPQDPIVRLCRMPSDDQHSALCIYWEDQGPGDVKLKEGPWITLVRNDSHRSGVKECGTKKEKGEPCDNNGYIDDRGYAFQTRIHDKRENGAWIWSSLFSLNANTWSELKREGTMRFRIKRAKPANAVLETPLFSSSAKPVQCNKWEERLCTEYSRITWWKWIK